MQGVGRLTLWSMKMKCDEAINKLDAYLAGELPEDIRAELAAHLESCVACRHAFERAERLATMLTETPAPPVPDNFSRNVLIRIKKSHAPIAPAWAITSLWSNITAPMRRTAAAMLLAGVAIGTIAGWNAPSEPRGVVSNPATKADLLSDYGLDALSETPEGSLAGGYLALLEEPNGEGR